MSNRSRIAVLCTGAATVLAVGVWALLPGATPTGQAAPAPAAADVTGSGPTTTTPAPTAAAVTTTTSAVPTTTTTARATTTTLRPAAAHTNPPPTAHPVTGAVPPPVHKAPVPGCAPTSTGPRAANADVQAALTTAAARHYWDGVSNPPPVAVDPLPDGGSTAPTTGGPAVITLPPTLLEAIAWQESGWNSTVKSCDGGLGLMQVMSDTAGWMNHRFGSSYDYTAMSGNAAIGAEYLQWLIAFFGENNFGYHYDMSDPDLLTAVIVGYNAGPSNVVFSGGHTVSSSYANNVRALMASQPWK